jgi:hypothetical protein
MSGNSGPTENKKQKQITHYYSEYYYCDYSNSDVIAMTHEKLYEREEKKKKKLSHSVLQKNLLSKLRETYLNNGQDDEWFWDIFVQPLKEIHTGAK